MEKFNFLLCKKVNMIKISEFNPSISNKKESSNSANCKVIINNSPSGSISPSSTFGAACVTGSPLGAASKAGTSQTNPTGQTGPISSLETSISTGPISSNPTSQTGPISLNNYVPEYSTSENLMLRENELFKHLAVSFSNILKSNNPKLIANLVDQSGKVILAANDLVTAISLILGINESSVKINYEDPEAGCLGKINPIKKISSIKTNGYDFQLHFNKEYNTLTEDFGVSLVKCLIMI